MMWDRTVTWKTHGIKLSSYLNFDKEKFRKPFETMSLAVASVIALEGKGDLKSLAIANANLDHITLPIIVAQLRGSGSLIQ